MALTTRCPHCGTAFKVVPDQLRIRNGLVRCGACSTVFDGRASLVQPADVPGRQAETPVAMPAATAARRRAGPCGSSLGSARDSDCPLPSRCRRGKTSLLSRNPRRGLGAAAIHDAARRAQPRTDPPAGAGPGRARDELDDDELLDDELHDDESQDDEPRGGRRHGEDGHDDASGWRDRADERYPHSRPRRHDSRSVAARRS